MYVLASYNNVLFHNYLNSNILYVYHVHVRSLTFSHPRMYTYHRSTQYRPCS